MPVHRVGSGAGIHRDHAIVREPFGIARAEPALDALATAAAILVGAGIVGGLVSLGLRLHRSDGLQRQQVKVLFYAATLSVGTLVGANMAFHDAMETTVVGNLVWGAAGRAFHSR